MRVSLASPGDLIDNGHGVRVSGRKRPQIGADDVNPLANSAFDLPDHLRAKADPALIAGDEQHFAAIAETLEASSRSPTCPAASMPSSGRPAA